MHHRVRQEENSRDWEEKEEEEEEEERKRSCIERGDQCRETAHSYASISQII